jgi:sugar O-acyltransferase (sialic acid O-acetyltransferase NeuD family)
MKRLALLGAGGHGKVVADTALYAGWQEVIFYDDAWPGLCATGIWTVIGDATRLLQDLPNFDGVVVTIGRNRTRLDKHQWLIRHGAPLVSVIHPTAVISQYATLGKGSVVMAGAVVNVDACLGEACVVNTGATVDHDDWLADGVHISPGVNLSGHVTVGEASWIGIGAAVRQGITIGREVTVGAGAVVVEMVPDGLTVFGNPAKPSRTGNS